MCALTNSDPCDINRAHTNQLKLDIYENTQKSITISIFVDVDGVSALCPVYDDDGPLMFSFFFCNFDAVRCL